MTTASLPRPATTFVGRERELDDLCTLLRRPDVRLLTVTGPGGCGKTRLALAAARCVAAEFGEGVVTVPLEGVPSAHEVPEAIARGLDVRSGTADGLGAVAAALAGRDVLLVLDGFEHVVDAAPDVVELLGDEGPCVLVTSREPLHVPGESEYPLDPLVEEEAVALFTERARSVLPSFDAGADPGVVATLCGRLDGLPLAIELAAARVRSFPPATLLERLGEGLDVLSSPLRGMPDRQRTLEGTIDWSYRLLGDEERHVLETATVFRDDAGLEALEAVCDASLETVASLVDKSLLRPVVTHGTARYAMLATVRAFAAQRLRRRGAEEEALRRHAEWVVRLVTSCAAEQWRACEDPAWRSRIDADLPNVRAALDWATDHDPALAATIAVWMSHYWSTAGLWREGRERLGALLPYAGALAGKQRTTLYVTVASAAGYTNEIDLAEEVLEQLRPLLEQDEPTVEQVTALLAAVWCAFARGQDDDALALAERCCALADRIGTPSLRAAALNHLCIATFAVDPARARAAGDEAVRLNAATGHRVSIRAIRSNLGLLDIQEGHVEAAEEAFEAVRAESRAVGDRMMELVATVNLGMCRVLLGEADAAAAELLTWLTATTEMGNRRLVGELLYHTAGVASLRGERGVAATLVGAADAIAERTGQPLSGWERRVREMVAAEPLDRARLAAGRALGEQEALALVREVLESAHRVVRTFVFTDVVRSTQLVAEMGDEAWARLLAWHDRALRALFAAHGGTELDHAGDGFAVAFATPEEAARCAIAIQRELAAHRRQHGFAPAVRIGMHRADAVVLEGLYRGVGMHVAARIGARAAGGEILASAATVAGLPLEVVAREEAELKGVPEPVALVTLAW